MIFKNKFSSTFIYCFSQKNIRTTLSDSPYIINMWSNYSASASTRVSSASSGSATMRAGSSSPC